MGVKISEKKMGKVGSLKQKSSSIKKAMASVKHQERDLSSKNKKTVDRKKKVKNPEKDLCLKEKVKAEVGTQKKAMASVKHHERDLSSKNKKTVDRKKKVKSPGKDLCLKEEVKTEVERQENQLCSKKPIQKAIKTVRQIYQKFLEKDSKTKPLLEENPSVFLQVTMKKIPPKTMTKMIKVHLPHSMVTDTTEVCLITGDLDKRNQKAEVEPDILHYKSLLKKEKITTINEVVTLRQLRTEYKTYESRRELMGAYDVFLSDNKITQCLPRLLGKAFYRKRKFPIQIDMRRPQQMKAQINRALSCTVFPLTCRGSSCSSEVAKLSMEDDQIVENVLSTLEVLCNQLPGKRKNINGLYLKLAKSHAIPIYVSFESPNDVQIEDIKSEEKVDFEDLSTLPNARVQVFSDGTVITQEENEELSCDEDGDDVEDSSSD